MESHTTSRQMTIKMVDPRANDILNKICKIGIELRSKDKELATALLQQFNERDLDGLTKLFEEFQDILAQYDDDVDVAKLCDDQMLKLRSIIILN